MTQVNNNTNLPAGKHLTYEERVKIEAYKEPGYSNRKITRILKRAPQTINNAVNLGTDRPIKQRQIHNYKVQEYDQYRYTAEVTYHTYMCNRKFIGHRLH